MKRFIALLYTAALCAAYCIIIIPGGHGAALVGLHLLGLPESATVPIVASIFGFISLLLSDLLVHLPWAPYVEGLGYSLLVFAWMSFLSRSDLPFATILSSVPAAAVCLVKLVAAHRRPVDAAAPDRGFPVIPKEREE